MDDPGWQSSFGLEPPAGGDDLSIAWRADLGGNLRIGDLAAHLKDLDVAVCVGERWGTELARASARQSLMNRFTREGPAAFWEVAEGMAHVRRWRGSLKEWEQKRRLGAGRTPFPYRDPDQLLETLADTQLAGDLGRPMTLVNVQYRNPVEVVLTGSGFLIAGTIYVLRLVRDWSNKRRIDAGAAREAEAVARQTEARADLLRWLVDETKAGRMPVPPGDLLGSVTHSEGGALKRLATADVTLELPKDFDATGGN